MTTSPAVEVDELIAQFLQELEQGRDPDPADWLARNPEHAGELAAFLADLGRFGNLLGLSHPALMERTTEYRPPAGVEGPSAIAASERFGEYELLNVIGRGGMGVVYRARLLGTTLVVALKQVSAGDRSPEATQRFREEIESAAGLRHPNIVPVYHVGEHDGQPFCTMALVEGGTLAGQMKTLADDPWRAAALVAKAARGVHYAHQRRVLHRDLKPSNILLDEAGEPQVADFGLAARLDDSGTATAAPAGSLPWMAPEATCGDAMLTTAVDVWALGVILYELLTGRRPFHATDAAALRAAILEQTPPPPRAECPRLSRDLDAICRRCLEKDPQRRYESAAAVALDLERWLRDEPVRARPAGRLERFTRWCRRNPGLAGGMLTLMCVLAAGTAASLSFIQDQDAAVQQAVCRANEYAAGHVANSVLRRLDELSQPVVAAAQSVAMREACRKADVSEARTALEKSFTLPSGRPSPYASVYLIKPDGHILALVRPAVPDGGLRPDIREKSFLLRDYFQGGLRHRDQHEVRNQVHVSRVFTSDNDEKDKLALSCPVTTIGKDSTWVLAAAITTDQTLGLINLQGEQHKAILVGPRDSSSGSGKARKEGGHLILVHPAFVAGDPAVPFRAEREFPGPDNEPELHMARTAGPPPIAADEDYHDPVADHGHPEYAGRWLTGSARVGHTELVVLVQQRYDDAVAPHRSYVRRFLAWVGAAFAAGLAAFVGLRLIRSRRPLSRTVERMVRDASQ